MMSYSPTADETTTTIASSMNPVFRTLSSGSYIGIMIPTPGDVDPDDFLVGCRTCASGGLGTRDRQGGG